MEKPTLGELTERLQKDIDHYGGSLPERVAIAWEGYRAALLEWDLISISDHAHLRGMLPHIHDDPVVKILLGR
ncbi:MAG: hypothetical protein IPK60_08510 [Sandaracinaceae bacterium]|nr:hypothetical protein [Sandaracinaceae bacterium]